MSLLFWMSWDIKREVRKIVTERRVQDTEKVLMKRLGQDQDFPRPGVISKAFHGNSFWFPLPIKTEYDILQFFSVSYPNSLYLFIFSKTLHLFMHSRFWSQKCLDLASTWCHGKAIGWLLRACCLDICISINFHVTLYSVQVPNLQKYQSTCCNKKKGTVGHSEMDCMFLTVFVSAGKCVLSKASLTTCNVDRVVSSFLICCVSLPCFRSGVTVLHVMFFCFEHWLLFLSTVSYQPDTAVSRTDFPLSPSRPPQSGLGVPGFEWQGYSSWA